MLEKFLARGYKACRTTLIDAVNINDLSMVKAILGSGPISPGKMREQSPPELAVYQANMSMVRLLVEYGNVNDEPRTENGRSPLQQAVEDGNLEIIQFLLDAGADVNGPPAKIRGATALQLAAINGALASPSCCRIMSRRQI
jgi:hypothetical protein